MGLWKSVLGCDHRDNNVAWEQKAEKLAENGSLVDESQMDGSVYPFLGGLFRTIIILYGDLQNMEETREYKICKAFPIITTNTTKSWY